MLGYSNITIKGQVTIPDGLRRYFKLKPQSRVVLIQEDDGIKVKRVKDFLSLRGSVKAPDKPVDPKKMRQSYIDYLGLRKQT